MSAVVALYGDHVIRGGEPVSDRCLGPYLQHSRQRHRAWRQAVAGIDALPPSDDGAVARCLRELLAEVLATEMFTRVWTAVLCQSDLACGVVHSDPIARHVLVGVLEVRSLLMTRLVDGGPHPLETLQQADALRRRCDRWTDLLIGELSSRHDVSRFAVNPSRAREILRSVVLRSARGAAGDLGLCSPADWPRRFRSRWFARRRWPRIEGSRRQSARHFRSRRSKPAACCNCRPSGGLVPMLALGMRPFRPLCRRGSVRGRRWPVSRCPSCCVGWNRRPAIGTTQKKSDLRAICSTMCSRIVDERRSFSVWCSCRT